MEKKRLQKKGAETRLKILMPRMKLITTNQSVRSIMSLHPVILPDQYPLKSLRASLNMILFRETRSSFSRIFHRMRLAIFPHSGLQMAAER